MPLTRLVLPTQHLNAITSYVRIGKLWKSLIGQSIPDSVNVAYQYSRVLGKKSNGNYDVEQRKLSVNSFRFPIMLYRVLMVASMLEGQCPYKESGNYIFPGISKSIVKELDRILCKIHSL